MFNLKPKSSLIRFANYPIQLQDYRKKGVNQLKIRDVGIGNFTCKLNHLY